MKISVVNMIDAALYRVKVIFRKVKFGKNYSLRNFTHSEPEEWFHSVEANKIYELRYPDDYSQKT